MKELIAGGWLIVFCVACVAVCCGAIAAAFEAATVAWQLDETKRTFRGEPRRPEPWFVRSFYVMQRYRIR
jgi:hypothetical protein